MPANQPSRRALSAAWHALWVGIWCWLGLFATASLIRALSTVSGFDHDVEVWETTSMTAKVATFTTEIGDGLESSGPSSAAFGARFPPESRLVPSENGRPYLAPPYDLGLPEGTRWSLGWLERPSGAARAIALELPGEEATALGDVEVLLAIDESGTWARGPRIRLPPDAHSGAADPEISGVEWADGTMLVQSTLEGSTVWIGRPGQASWRRLTRPAPALPGARATPIADGRVFEIGLGGAQLWSYDPPQVTRRPRPSEPFHPAAIERLEDGRIVVVGHARSRDRNDIDFGLLLASALLGLALVSSIWLVTRRRERALPGAPSIGPRGQPEARSSFAHGFGWGALGALALAFFIGLSSDTLGFTILGGVALTALVIWLVVYEPRQHMPTSPRAVALGVVLGSLAALVLLAALLLGFVMSFGGGRPAHVAGRVVAPRVCRGQARKLVRGPSSWFARRVGLAHWIRCARLEAASVPTFRRLASELSLLGAPPELVAYALEAAQDETEHARVCLAIAQRHSTRALALEPAASQLPAARPISAETLTLVLARESLIEGCLGEGFAAQAALASVSEADDESVRAALLRIAADEARHAELAWQVLAWCLARGGEPVRNAVAETLAQLEERRPVRGARRGKLTVTLARAGIFCEQVPGTLHAQVVAATAARCGLLIGAGRSPLSGQTEGDGCGGQPPTPTRVSCTRLAGNA